VKYRQKVLLYLVDALNDEGKKITKTFLDKLLIVAAKETALNEKPFYNFYPHHFGPFSDSYYADFEQLNRNGYLRGFDVTPIGVVVVKTVRKKDKAIGEDLSKRFKNQQQVVDYVYAQYPEYTVKSQLPHATPYNAGPGIFSIGYQGKDSDAFLDVLIQNQIQEVVDVRANPLVNPLSKTLN